MDKAGSLPEIGDKAMSKRKYSSADVKLFAQLSGDVNPVHLDPEYASRTIFKKAMVHGMFVASQISELIANRLPGPGSIYLHQSLQFTRPVHHDDVITCEVEVINVKPEKRIVELKTTCLNESGNTVIEGAAIIKII